jgi:hypothetical protein
MATIANCRDSGVSTVANIERQVKSKITLVFNGQNVTTAPIGCEAMCGSEGFWQNAPGGLTLLRKRCLPSATDVHGGGPVFALPSVGVPSASGLA